MGNNNDKQFEIVVVGGYCDLKSDLLVNLPPAHCSMALTALPLECCPVAVVHFRPPSLRQRLTLRKASGVLSVPGTSCMLQHPACTFQSPLLRVSISGLLAVHFRKCISSALNENEIANFDGDKEEGGRMKIGRSRTRASWEEGLRKME
uniref:HDC18309 n=1 Tax=Drosophila melanogaster TaxID=7227 RepID=Q6IIG8_DROME|nr:TPA_inf: HDC18309 [Drosophila melanogaster]